MGGYALGVQQAEQDRARDFAQKQFLSDQELEQKANELVQNRKAIQQKLPTLLDANNQPTPEYHAAIADLTKNSQDLRELYHPDKNPGAISKFGHILTDHLHITSPQERAQQAQQKQAALTSKDQAEAQSLAAAAPPSLAQQEVQRSAAATQAALAAVRGSQQAFMSLNPKSTPEEQSANLNLLMQKYFGIQGRGHWTTVTGKINGKQASLLLDSVSGQYRNQDGSPVPPEILDQWVPDQKVSAAADKHQAFLDWQKNNPGNPMTEIAWEAQQSATGHASAPRPQNRDDKYIALESKKTGGQPLTKDESDWLAAYDMWVKNTKTDPGIARAVAYGENRYIPVIDPDDPERTTVMKASEAAKAKVGTPQSIGYQTDKAVTRYMTSGPGGLNIAYFNTAVHHLRLLRQTSEALQNGDMQQFNKWANQFATATGSPAPTNFETVKAAVAGELSKTFRGAGATDSEIADINTTMNQAQSPAQIDGAVDYYTRLMNGKLEAMKAQYEAGKSGAPAFPGSNKPQTSAPKSNLKVPKGATHKIEYQGKWYYTDSKGNNLGEVK